MVFAPWKGIARTSGYIGKLVLERAIMVIKMQAKKYTIHLKTVIKSMILADSIR